MNQVQERKLSAADLFIDADNVESAREYLRTRHSDLERFLKSLEWEPVLFGSAIKAKIAHRYYIVHELRPCTMHATPIWGELFFDKNQLTPLWGESVFDYSEVDEVAGDLPEPSIFLHFESFAAYVLKRWW